jgi:ATP-dependent exoDNAse (exonuclease V) alpha subunit
MLLQNLDPRNGLYNGTRMILIHSTQHVLQCRVLRRRNEGGEEEGENIVMIPRMGLDVNKEEYPIPLRRLQFPVQVGYAMTINKAQGQSMKHVGLDL